jgi:hypothetical protein
MGNSLLVFGCFVGGISDEILRQATLDVLAMTFTANVLIVINEHSST